MFSAVEASPPPVWLSAPPSAATPGPPKSSGLAPPLPSALPELMLTAITASVLVPWDPSKGAAQLPLSS